MNHLPSSRPWDRETEKEKLARASGEKKVKAQNELEALAVRAAEKEIARINRKGKSAVKEKLKNRPKVMKLYLLTRIGSQAGYDEYNNAVVMATSPTTARRIHPDGSSEPVSFARSGWPAFKQIRATYLGDAHVKLEAIEPQLSVINASFNAG